MSKIILTRGIPGSGKSTWAKLKVEDGQGRYVRFNRDDMRESVFGVEGMGSSEVEKLITQITEFGVRKALNAGNDVIIDAMNLNPRYLKSWARFGVPVEFRDFPTPIGECITRDNERTRNVGIRAISKIAKRFNVQDDGTLPPAPVITPHNYLPAAPYSNLKTDAYIVDIDGTLADHEGVRNPYDTSRYHLDRIHHNVRDVVANLGYGGYHIIIVSGRSEEFRKETEELDANEETGEAGIEA